MSYTYCCIQDWSAMLCVNTFRWFSKRMCVCVCVCVCPRSDRGEGKRERWEERSSVAKCKQSHLHERNKSVHSKTLDYAMTLKISQVRSTYVCVWYEIHICNNRKHKLRQAACWPTVYSMGSSAQCYVAGWMGGEPGGEWIHVSVWLSPLAVLWSYHSIVNWLYSNTK